MPPSAQTELPLDAPDRSPDLAADGAAWLTAFLAANPAGPGRGGAWPGREICRAIGRPWNERSRRRLRAFRALAGPIIVSGPDGYQHVLHCSLSARRRAAEIRLAQARRMAREALRELRALHAAAAISRAS